MVKCPFCSYANEDGALFCEQCKSDISNVPPTPPTPPPPMTPMPESIPPVPLALAEEEPIVVALAEDVPEVKPVEEVPAIAIVEEVPEAAVVVEASPAPPPLPAPPADAAIAAVAAEAAPAPAKPAGAQTPIPPGATVKLVVQRGLKIGEEFALFPGENYVGRADEKPVDIDLTFQEPEDRVWCSRQHALLSYDDATGTLTIEDLNSANGTFVNRERVYPGQPRQLFAGNTIQIGTVHLRVKV
jgi:FHA domain